MEGVRERRAVVHPFRRLSNFRDVGGVKTADGRTFRAGVLFRSDELSRLNARDLVELQALGIKLICDLRSPGEGQRGRPRPGDGSLRVVNVPLVEQGIQASARGKLLGFLFGKTGGDRFREFIRGYYHHVAFGQTARICQVITLLSQEQNLPALIHCTAGKDRTGILAALVQLVVGVPYEVVREDYRRTNDYLGPRLEKLIKVMRIMTLSQVSPERIRLILTAQPEFLDEVHDAIVERYGGVETYLREACAISRATLQKLEEQLLA